MGDRRGVVSFACARTGTTGGRRRVARPSGRHAILLTGAGQPAHGWLVLDAAATIVAADASVCPLIGVRDPDDLRGRALASIVSPADSTALVEARRVWRGALRFVGAPPDATRSQAINVEIVPVDVDSGPAFRASALVHLYASAPLAVPPVPPVPPAEARRARPEADDAAVLAAQVIALETIAALPEAGAAARGVLLALSSAVAFDWGAVLRSVEDPRLDAAGAEVVAVYPAPMAGIDCGSAWSPLDPAQAGVLASGEPELTTRLGSEAGVQSSLRRMPAFGMTSRLHVPLYDGPRVADCLVIYASGAPHGIEDGIAAERVARSLGAFLPAHTPAGRASFAEPQVPAREIPGTSARVRSTEREAAAAEVRAASGTAPGAATRLSALSEVIAGVAHELNNPLTAILGYAQIFNAPDGAERDHAVNTIEREAQRAARIVRNLLSFARQEPPHISRVNVEEILRHVIEVVRYALEVDNVRTELRLAGVPDVDADGAQLEQVFVNLVSNAQQALQPGGGQLLVTTSTVGDHVRVSFADNGPGVPEEMRDRVFEPFFTTQDLGGGQGMGLAAVYGVITQHGGRVWVEPSPSGGANFIVELPAMREVAPPPARTARADRPRGARSARANSRGG